MTEELTLRDYFAAKVLQGLYANDGLLLRKTHSDIVEDPDHAIAELAYRAADAMIAAREVSND